jgi:hypothetical protein
MSATTIEVSKVRTDGDIQPRGNLSDAAVADYAEAMKTGANFPPVEVFEDDGIYWLADGFHRHAAAVKAGIPTLMANIRKGSKRDALLHSVGANADHGLRRTNADKRRAVRRLLVDAEWQSWGDNEIARRCRVSQPFVASIRRASSNGLKMPTRRAQRNGTTYSIRTGRIGAKPKAGPQLPPSDSTPAPATGAEAPPPEASGAPRAQRNYLPGTLLRDPVALATFLRKHMARDLFRQLVAALSSPADAEPTGTPEGGP